MAGFALGHGAAARRRVPAISAPAPAAAPLSAVADDGWQATVASPADLSLVAVAVDRAGFDAAGAAVRHPDTLRLTKRVRLPAPNAAGQTPDRVALSDYLYAGDAIAGVANNSTETSPKPVAAWVMPSRLLVGGGVHWELIAFHRDARGGRQVACVRVRANSAGGATPWQTIAATALSTLCEDRAAVEVYRGDLDVSALADGLVWLEAEVYPWIGDAASVRTTADYGGAGEFGPRHYLKDVARAAAPPLAYLSPAGNNATGIWSTDAAAAKAKPFATDAGARDAIYTSPNNAVTGGRADGCRIRAMAGTNVLTSSNAALRKRLDAAALVIERDPDSPRSACIVSFGVNGWGPNTGVRADGSGVSLLAPLTETATLFHDVSVQRTGTGQIGATASGSVTAGHFVQYHDVAFDAGGQATTWIAGGQVFDAAYGLEITGGSPNLQNGASSRRRCWRGLRATGVGIEGNLVVGCEITQPGAIQPTTAGSNGMVAYANRLLRVAATTFGTGMSASPLDRFVLAQNLLEFTGTNGGIRAVSISADGGATGLTHPIVIHNTATGIGSVGRWNMLYDETAGTLRTHRLQRVSGNLLAQINQKGDEFCAERGDGDAAAHLGNFAFEHGVGSAGNYAVYVDAGNLPSFRQLYPGMGSLIAAGDPLYRDYRGTAGTAAAPVAGAGGGDYRLQPASPARGLLPGPVLAFDLAGSARGSGAQAAGAYG